MRDYLSTILIAKGESSPIKSAFLTSANAPLNKIYVTPLMSPGKYRTNGCPNIV
jgi:hypothetical protein